MGNSVKSISVAFFLSSGALSGGAKVVLEHAERLSCIFGVNSTVFVEKTMPYWFKSRYSQVIHCGDFRNIDLSGYQVAVITSPNQLNIYLEWRHKKPFIHLCQGYEGDYIEDLKLWHLTRLIDDFYSYSCRRVTVNKFVANRLKMVNARGKIQALGQPIPLGFPVRPIEKGKKEKEVLIVGSSLIPFKGVEDALKIALFLKKLKGFKIVRISPHDTRKKEKNFCIDSFFVKVPPAMMPSFYKKAYITIYMPFKDGFGLPVLESIACGTPVISRKIPPVEETCGKKYPLFGNWKDALRFALDISDDFTLYQEVVKLGYRRLKHFSPFIITLKFLYIILDEYLRWLTSSKKNFCTQ